jgi:hypothetical protein
MANNKLAPILGQPRRGVAQVWRAAVRRFQDGLSVDCWMLRRIGSGVGQQLELVSGERIRDRGYQDVELVEVSIYGRWDTAPTAVS